MSLLRLGIIGRSAKDNEYRLPIHPDHLSRLDPDLFSKTLGSCQRLPNGNTLITESENGRALEVTRDKRVVWEFYNPHRAGARGELVAVLFEMLRLPPDFPFRGTAG